MVNKLNNEILAKVDEILLMIQKSNEYQKYEKLQKTLEKNKKIQILINEIRVLQKDTVHHLETEDKLKKKQEELENIPLYREYVNTLAELNNIYNLLETSINHYFDKIFN